MTPLASTGEQDRQSVLAPNVSGTAADRRLDLIRGEIEVQISICIAQLEIVLAFLMVRHDSEAIKTVGDARDRMRAALAQAARLEQALEDAGILAEAAAEWRSQSDSRRRA